MLTNPTNQLIFMTMDKEKQKVQEQLANRVRNHLRDNYDMTNEELDELFRTKTNQEIYDTYDDLMDFVRVCSECGAWMNAGYYDAFNCVHDEYCYYCSDECLTKHISIEEWIKLCEENPDDMYYTEWY